MKISQLQGKTVWISNYLCTTITCVMCWLLWNNKQLWNNKSIALSLFCSILPWCFFFFLFSDWTLLCCLLYTLHTFLARVLIPRIKWAFPQCVFLQMSEVLYISQIFALIWIISNAYLKFKILPFVGSCNEHWNINTYLKSVSKL